jgi:hypothetical protein
MAGPTKSSSNIARLHRLRWLVGLLGSKKHHGWWDCAFLDETGIRFLSTTFPRSARAAAFNATIEAAQRVHDDAVGKGSSYNLFRLPLAIEDHLQEFTVDDTYPLAADAARAELRALADASIKAPEGPVQVGIASRILADVSLQELAAHYTSAFAQGLRCFPYFSNP